MGLVCLEVEFCVGDLVEAKEPDEESSGIGEVVNLLPNDRVMVAFEIEGKKMISVFEDNQLEHAVPYMRVDLTKPDRSVQVFQKSPSI